jgi:hypothetical protein
LGNQWRFESSWPHQSRLSKAASSINARSTNGYRRCNSDWQPAWGQAALHFEVGISTVISWARRFRETGSVLPGKQRSAWQIGWAQAEDNWRRASCLSAGSDQGERLYLARARGRTRRARPQGRLPDSVEFCPRREAELQNKPWSPANRTVPTSREGGPSGQSIRAGSNRSTLVRSRPREGEDSGARRWRRRLY